MVYIKHFLTPHHFTRQVFCKVSLGGDSYLESSFLSAPGLQAEALRAFHFGSTLHFWN